MHNELMLRLLKNRKIVGFKLILVSKEIYGTFCTKTKNSYKTLGDLHNYWQDFNGEIKHDSFEYGLKINDDWWFEGDIIAKKPVSGELCFDKKMCCWGYVSYQHGDFIPFIGISNIDQFKNIGNIHELSLPI